MKYSRLFYLSSVLLTMLLFSCQNDKPKSLNKKVEKVEQQEKPSLLIIQHIDYPDWIKGVWHNIYESNTNRFETFAFDGGEVQFLKGLTLNGSRRILKREKIKEQTSDSTYSVTFKEADTVFQYMFRLQKLEWSEEDVLTYSIHKGNELVRDHFTSCQLVLVKQK